MDITEILNKNPALLLALFSLIAFPVGLLLLGFVAQKLGIGKFVQVMQDHVATEVKIEGRLSEILTELKNQNAANWDNRRYLDEQFDFVKESLKTLLNLMPKRSGDA